MLCHDLMKTAVRCVPPEATVEDAAAIMRDEGIGFYLSAMRAATFLERLLIGT